MVDASNGLQNVSIHRNILYFMLTYLSKHIADLKDLQLGAPALVILLGHRVGHNDLVQCTSVDALDSISTQDTVCNERNHLRSTLLLQELCRAGNGIGRIRQVIDKDSCALSNVSNQHHGRILSVVDLCGAALLVDEGKRHAESVGNGGRALRTSSVGGNYHGLLVVWNVELDVFAEEMAAIKVIYGDVEEALVLGV